MATNVINIRRFVDVTTGVNTSPAVVARDWGAFLFVQKGADGAGVTITKYDDLAAVISGAGSNSEAAKAMAKFYGTTYGGFAPTSACYVAEIGAADDAELAENFTAVLASEEYYLISVDENFDASQRKALAALCEASQATAAHKLFLEDNSADAINKNIEEDTASLSAYCFNNKLNSVVTIWVNSDNEEQYYAPALASFYATRRFNNGSRRMASVAHKAASGIAPVDLASSVVSVSPTQGFDNLDSKNCNVYANIKIVGLPAWERGNAASGDDVSDLVSADYLQYTVTISVFNALQTNPRIPMNNDGAVILAGAIELGFERLSSSGVIAGGVSLDGEAFPATGYKINIPIPTGVAKANGLWENIEASALLAGSCKKVVIGNTLKK